MGALTLKSFPFELRGWEVEKVESFDPTDGFCSTTWIYLNKNQIVQIEPIFTFYKNNWLNDKGRQFFDTIFLNLKKSKKTKKESWLKLYDQILKTLYLFDYCRSQTSKNYFFIILFDHLSNEILGILNFISNKYSFIALKQAQSFNKTNIDLQNSFQLNNLLTKTSIISSTLCLLIATNPRYEGHVLNLNLRQRVLKKKFKCIVIGSLINLTFPVSFLGSNTNIIKTITEGNNFICQNFKNSKNPFLVCNYELFKRTDNKTINQVFKTLFCLHVFNKIWHSLNILSSSIHETGLLTFNQITKFKIKDLSNFSCIYFLNVTTDKIASLNKLMELQLLKHQLFAKVSKNIKKQKLFLDQNYKMNINFTISNKIITDYLYIPTNTFYDNEETYISTEGFIKKTTKIISKNNIKSTWQILRKTLNYFKNNLVSLNKKNNHVLFFNSKKLYDFKNYLNFQNYPIKKITHLSCYLNIKNKTFIINTIKFNFKPKLRKLIYTKLKYWLDDFFNSNKDQFSQYSTVLTSCSVYLRQNSTNFF